MRRISSQTPVWISENDPRQCGPPSSKTRGIGPRQFIELQWIVDSSKNTSRADQRDRATVFPSARIPALRSQAWIGVSVFVLGIWSAYELGNQVVANDLSGIGIVAFGIAGCSGAILILRNWRTGFYFFLVWLLFEDLARKYFGNGTALFFGKDLLAALTYISLLVAIRRGREKTFRVPFLLPLLLFVWLGAAQIFNQNSPSIVYGLLGFKLYFFYVPLIWVGYALIRDDEDLRKFLVANAALGGLISALAIVQAIVGHSFLNPVQLAPELQDLGELDKITPISGQIFSLPTSVFVSAGRLSLYLVIASILTLGTTGYLLLYTKRSRKFVLAMVGLVGGAVLFSGARTAVVYSTVSALVFSAGFLWGAPWQQRQAHRITKAVRRSFVAAALALAALLLIFPNEAGSRVAFYAETLSPSSSSYEIDARGWTYPIHNLLTVFDGANWVFGNGTGTASLGTQYVGKLLGQHPPQLGVEEGYGSLIVEMGIIAPFLWILWTAVLLYQSWEVVSRLRGTRFFPIAFAIFWYALLLLYPLTFVGLAPYQNYIDNAYLWLLLGVLFRLPRLLATAPAMKAAHPAGARGGLEF